jgi:hypothetical protein
MCLRHRAAEDHWRAEARHAQRDVDELVILAADLRDENALLRSRVAALEADALTHRLAAWIVRRLGIGRR